MLTELKNIWIKALRSGKYKQGQSYLRQRKRDAITNLYDEQFCCLGVLCDVMNKKRWHRANGYFAYSKKDTKSAVKKSGIGLAYFNNWEYMPLHVIEEIGMTFAQQRELAAKNDKNDTFSNIADYIEQNL